MFRPKVNGFVKIPEENGYFGIKYGEKHFSSPLS
jgi:hypothetical protein